MLKPGVTESGRRAALSHTGTLAGEDRIVDAAFRQCGALRAADSDEAWAAAMALVSLPRMKSSGVVVVSDGGGHATIVSDSAARAGLTLPDLSARTQAALAELLPPRSTMNNPVDFAGKAEEEPEVIPRVIDVCLADEGIGSVILAGHFGGYFKDRTEDTACRELASAQALAAAVVKHGKPFVLHTDYGSERLPTLEPLRLAAVPIFESLELSARALGYAWREARRPERRSAEASPLRPDRAAVDAILRQAAGTPRRLAEPEARALLALYGVPVPPFRVALSVAQAQAAAREFAVPVALKLIAPDLVHKSDAGGVLLNVDGEAAAGRGYQTLIETAGRLRARDARILVTPMIAGGIEVVVGGLHDEQFGFAAAGLAVLVFDHRSFDASDGAPRQEIDPVAQTRDFRHALSFAATRADVDAQRLGVWGTSYSGGHALVVGAIDRRVECVVAQAPLISGWRNVQRLVRADLLAPLRAMCDADRAARFNGDAPAMLPVVSADPFASCALPTLDAWPWFSEATAARAPAWPNELILRSFEMLMECEPGATIERISPTPLLMIVAKQDHVTVADEAFAAFERAWG